MDYDIIVREHLDNIEKYLNDLEALTNVTFDNYKKDIKTQRFSERTLHIMIEEMLDVAKTIIEYKQFRQPTSHDDTFTVLFEHKIIPKGFHQTAKDIACFGNRLIHDYKELSADMTFTVIKNGSNDIRLFVKHIRKWFSDDNMIKQIM